MAQLIPLLWQVSQQFDRRWRRYRYAFSWQKYRNYRAWLAGQSYEIPQDRPLVVFDFATTRVDGPQGRRFYGLFIFFVRAGYFPVLRENYLFLSNMDERFKALCSQERFSLVKDWRQLPAGYLVVTDRQQLPKEARPERRVQIDYRPDFDRDCGDFPWPFSLFPSLYALGQDQQLNAYRRTPRNLGIFFGGDAETRKYTKPVIERVYQKLPRARALDSLRRSLSAERWCEPVSNPVLLEKLSKGFAGLLVVNTRQCQIPTSDWLASLAKARFFLACPGVRYPMSHNLIEALAVGTVPILQYPELCFPPLVDGENCLTFNGEVDLHRVVERALTLGEAEWQRLSAGASRYYDTYLDPEAAVARLLAQPGDTINLRLLPFLKKGGGFA